MSSWRFYPLAEFPTAGVLVKDGVQPVAARYWTLKEAKAAAPRLLTDQRKVNAA